MPSTFLLWGEELIITNNDVEVSTYKKHESNESNNEDPIKGRI